MGHSPWGHKESDTAEQLTLSLFISKLPFDLTLVFLHAAAKKKTVSLKLGSSVLTSSSPGPPGS